MDKAIWRIITKRILSIMIGISLIIATTNCTKYKEEVPFFDGLSLEYDTSPGHYKLIYDVHVFENNKYKIIETDTAYKTDRGKKEMYIDKHGKIYETSGYRKDIGNFSPIWIPVHEIEIGDKFDNRFSVIREDKWEMWDVLVAKDMFANAESYYDLNTGFWVGGVAKTARGIGRIILTNTNAGIPVAK